MWFACSLLSAPILATPAAVARRSTGPTTRHGGYAVSQRIRKRIDVRYATQVGSACAEFSCEGHDDNDPVCGHGWVMIGTAKRLVGHFYIHNGDDSALVCERE